MEGTPGVSPVFDAETWNIVWASVRFSFFSTLFAAVPAIVAGTALSIRRGTRNRTIAAFMNSLTAVPTVVVGLAVYALISRSGPLGFLGMLYRPEGVVLGQAALAFPVTCASIYAGFSKLDPRFVETVRTLGAGRAGTMIAALREGKLAIASAVVAAFGRVTGEVGVSMMLGGNIRGFTRTMTTAIALDTAKGEFERALALGLVLLSIAVAVNLAAYRLVRHER